MFRIPDYAEFYIVILLQLLRFTAFQRGEMKEDLPAALAAGYETKIALQCADLQQPQLSFVRNNRIQVFKCSPRF